MRTISFVFAFCLLAVVFTSPALVRAGEKSWTGKEIIMKRNGIKIGQTDANGRQTYFAKLTAMQYRVLDDREGWLKVQVGKQAGWFDKNDAVLAEDADAYFSALLRREPSNDQYYARRGWAWHVLGEYDKAVGDYAQAIRLRPNELDWLTNRALIHRSHLRYEASARDYTKAMNLNPNSVTLYHSRGWSYGLNEEFEKAFADFDEALRLEPQNPYTYNRRGLVRVKAGDFDGALKDYAEVIRLLPDYMWAYSNRGIAFNRKGEYGKALADFEKAMKMEPEELGPQANLAWLLATCPDPKFRDAKRALALAAEVCARSRFKDPFYLGTLGAACALNGQFDEAIKWQQKALENAGYARIQAKDAEERLQRYAEKKPYTVALDSFKKTPLPEPKEIAKTPPPTLIAAGPLKGWREFKSADGGFSIAFPENPKFHKQSIVTPVGKVDNFAFSHEGAEMTYLASYFDLPQDGILTLDKAAAAYALGRKGSLVSQKNVAFGKGSGREVMAQLPDKNVSRMRMFVVGQRWYQVIVDGPADRVNGEQANGFFESFKLNR